MNARVWLAVAVLVGLGLEPAQAEPALYTLTGMGTGVAGTSKCATYQVTVDLVVDGKNVKGTFRQRGRPERGFAATLDEKGAFKTKADVGEGNTMDVSGSISTSDGRILLDGYCKFEGKLARTK
jgi:hypothetical protein